MWFKCCLRGGSISPEPPVPFFDNNYKKPKKRFCCLCIKERPKSSITTRPESIGITVIELPSRNGSVIKENGFSRSLRNSEASRSDTSLAKSNLSLKSDLASNKSIENGLTVSTPSLQQNSDIIGQNETPGTSVTSSMASVNSQLRIEEIDNEVPVEEPIEATAEQEEAPSPPSQDYGLNNTNEKATGTPNSELGSESSKNSEGSGTIVDSPKSDQSSVRAKRRIPRPIESYSKPKINGKDVKGNSLYPPSLPPLENPKEAFAKALLQMGNPEWEVVMQGLLSIVRLSRHHNKVLLGSTHSLVLPLTKQIKNLRSQVSRGACQCTGELFGSLGKHLDSEVEDLAGALLSRMADTNKFLRADSSAALDVMVDHTSPVKSVAALVSKGAKHQNAVIRGATCRLLLKLCARLGHEKVMALPRETRDSILITGAKFLTEGSLETRRYAKEMFTILSADAKLHSTLAEIVPHNIMRSIQKVLLRISSNP